MNKHVVRQVVARTPAHGRDQEMPVASVTKRANISKRDREGRGTKYEKARLKKRGKTSSKNEQLPILSLVNFGGFARKQPREKSGVDVKRETVLVNGKKDVELLTNQKMEKPQHVKQEDGGPYRQFYIEFGRKMTNAEHIAELFKRSEAMQLAATFTPRLCGNFEDSFCKLMVLKGRNNREILDELEALRVMFQNRRMTPLILQKHLEYVRTRP